MYYFFYWSLFNLVVEKIVCREKSRRILLWTFSSIVSGWCSNKFLIYFHTIPPTYFLMNILHPSNKCHFYNRFQPFYNICKQNSKLLHLHCHTTCIYYQVFYQLSFWCGLFRDSFPTDMFKLSVCRHKICLFLILICHCF